MNIFKKVDEFGVQELRLWTIAATCVLLLAVLVSVLGYAMYHFESAAGNANILSWRDGAWTLSMIVTTIGFGDFYPVTDYGRAIAWVGVTFGAVALGGLVGVGAKAIGFDSGIQNRELKNQQCEILRKLEAVEEHMGLDNAVDENSNLLDYIIEQAEYESDMLVDGWLTAGLDSAGQYTLSIEAYHRETGIPYKRWFQETCERDLMRLYNHYLERADEL